MTVYPGDPRPGFRRIQTLENNGVNLTEITIGSHTGTHVDAPTHFFSHGNGVDKDDLGKFMGEALIADLSGSGARGITGADLEGIPAKQGDILLIYTGTGRSEREFAYLEPEAAEWIARHGLKCVGIDTLSVERFERHDAPVHKKLLGNNIGIIENLDDSLGQFVNRRMLLLCFFLPFENLDGSPARAILVDIMK